MAESDRARPVAGSMVVMIADYRRCSQTNLAGISESVLGEEKNADSADYGLIYKVGGGR